MKLHNWFIAGLVACAACTQAMAGTIELALTGVNLNYSSSSATLTDSGAPSDPLTAIIVTEDGTPVVGSPYSGPGTALELSLSGVTAIPATGGMATTAAGGNLEVFGPGGVSLLDLTLDSFDVIYTPISFGLFQVNILFAGGLGAIDSQAIPGISGPITDPVTISFNLQGTVTSSGGFLTGFSGSGGGTISAETAVPEPSTIAMMGLGGLMSLMVYSRYRLG